ncbi:MAG: protein kinase [Planctomycetaceae bacterium]|nr:protein kinase [Planctomycetaceae bacterium]
MAVAAPEFLEALHRSGVVPPSELKAALAQIPTLDESDPEALANQLVREKVLTSYQAREILAGRHRRLRFEHLVIRDILGVGGMGTVFLAIDTRQQTEVALKVLAEKFKHDAGMRARFRLEARAGLRLQHPKIVRTYELGVTDDVFGEVDYSTMELFPGIALHELVGIVKGLPYPVACDIASQTAEALGAVHQQGMVHRDVKPDNVLIDRTGEVKIVDFGLAMLHEAARDEEFSLAMIFGHECLGTSDYMPPEQARDSLHVDARADIYGLGCTLYVALTAKRPFAGTSSKEIIEAHRTQPIPNPQAIVPDIPDELVRVLERMMAKSPDDRFATVDEVQAALRPFARRRAIDFDFEQLKRVRMRVAVKLGRLSLRQTSTATRLSSAARISSSTARSTDGQRTTEATGGIKVDLRPHRSSSRSSRQPTGDESASAEAEQLLAGFSVSDKTAAATGAMLRLPDGALYRMEKSSFVIGRSPAADLTIDSKKLSSRHCRVFFDGQSWNVADLDSKNGMTVNGQPTLGSPLYRGDRLILADDVPLKLEWPHGPRRGSTRNRWMVLSVVLALVGLGLLAWWQLAP